MGKSQQILPAAKPPSNIPEAIPPWTLDAECWLFPFYTTSSQISSNKQQSNDQTSNSASVLAHKQGIDAGAYHPLEDVSHITTDVFKGGLGGWILYRYASSPVGPYDELIYVAGSFQSKDSGTSGLRITNIYVSTHDSVWNGRRNWNIPKHVAKFEWSHPFRARTTEPQTVKIFHPSLATATNLPSAVDDQKPFFSATFTQSKYLPYLPINTKYFPSLPLIQPPLQAGLYKRNSREAQVETESLPNDLYRSTSPTFKGKFTLAYCQYAPGQSTYGDGVSFPKATNTLGYGCYMPNIEVGFPWSVEYPSTK
ncbi:uncharacterized protein FA14DRAFT_31742 [Meira miltonrushii]|uniref:Uncharacterized protein n=1 Tax=Meira miltonrushii TaxID=1280837 RepID=A0A316VE61_9BASI|nr:uncharacterized protein FA14DRAFT_31742 [Meira miltonrushii]PWN34563.1 hypothetical protein FA14DRAFT_31742 [Meira miltonrushii]